MWHWNDKKKRTDLYSKLERAFKEGALSSDNEIVAEFTRLFPKDPFPFFLLGNDCKAKKDYKSAFENYRRAAKLLEDDFDASKIGMFSDLCRSIFDSAVFYYTCNKQCNRADAISLVEQLIREGHRDALLYLTMGVNAFEQEKYWSAEYWLTTALRRPISQKMASDAHLYRGWSRIELLCFSEGSDDLVRSRELDVSKAKTIDAYLREKQVTRAELVEKVETYLAKQQLIKTTNTQN